jgi:molybdopterin molybdotransferase
MSGFVEEVRPIGESLGIVADALGFPWETKEKKVLLKDALFARSSRDIIAPESSPPFTRSLRDGYAVSGADTVGASPGSPVFLKVSGEVTMGAQPNFGILPEEAASIPTGGMLPPGADAVVMLEDTKAAGGWVEIGRSVQRGENVAAEGEEIRTGGLLVGRGDILDCPASGLLAAFGISEIGAADVKIGVISTGDEIVPVETSPLPIGLIRDSNTFTAGCLLQRYGFGCLSYGISSDDWTELRSVADRAVGECDVVLLSGGSSVGARDNTVRIVESLAEPGLLVRGINMVPGKPTILGGSRRDKKLVAGLPGHPLSCMVSMIFVILPALLSMIGAREKYAGRYLDVPLVSDAHGRAGPDEFIPMRLDSGAAFPLAAKSGYVSAMMEADGFIRIPPEAETQRAGEKARVWLW